MTTKRTLSEAVKFIGAVVDEWQLYSDKPLEYTIGPPIGFGASSVVYQAEYRAPSGESIQCALKVLDLDSLSSSALGLLQRETQLMSLSKHPNVLRVRGSWMDGHKLCIATRLMASGSVADVMHYKWSDGVEEEVTKCILKQALQGLNYLHVNGFIHRDIKAANLLVDEDGTVLLGDLGAASQAGSGPKRPLLRKRKSFVGTPCWMAPEVISQKSYDSKADIWSLGITALELAQGRPPRSREQPERVLLKTVQEEPPSLDRRSARFKYSRAFNEFVQSCLQKNPNNRPTAADLLQLPYFKNVKKKTFLVGALLSECDFVILSRYT
ncbi:hypothetical protein M422DRAFT_166319 [Sphaerobolus stellatus SS14]|uniref:non-specific serine/threonine protein kinase n=1 Tax=Sphaerobolus stellatus (strain SS14) TaxID=990650 RepID=A0A0C9VF19_SPHS4|nr:hypothetical protein M422DRAFT_166319 [Sphaerobolus stellatus SS14]